jgi:hypothetical protein
MGYKTPEKRLEEMIERRKKNQCLWCGGPNARLPEHFHCNNRPEQVHAPSSSASARLAGYEPPKKKRRLR